MKVLERNISLSLPDVSWLDTVKIVMCSQSIHSWALLWPVQPGSWNSGRKGIQKGEHTDMLTLKAWTGLESSTLWKPYSPYV